MDRDVEIARSIIKKFRKDIWVRFVKSIENYQLIQEGDKIAVCISGGKDSFLLAVALRELQRHWIVKFELEYIVMNPGYSEQNAQMIDRNAQILNLPLKIFNTDIFEVVTTVTESPCYLCARMRRGHLYKFAQDLGCNKIALGHHFNDVVETVLMSTLYGADYKTMMPKLHATNFKGMQLIRPLYLVKEDAVIAWKDYNHLEFLQCACRFTENAEQKQGSSKRQETKELIRELKKKDPCIDDRIFISTHNVNLDTLIGYRLNGVKYSFLDDYDQPTAKRLTDD